MMTSPLQQQLYPAASRQQQPQGGGGPIERLLIVHLTLAQICTGRELSDEASEEELLEPILYYYSSLQPPPTNTTPPRRTTTTQQQEAIQYRLPQSIGTTADRLGVTSVCITGF
jgi:hypothetical protein